ncbi:GAF domain-containing sensor histidine kinase [Nocardioides rubriscoriae]|uniref:GAF domain-containing sensor histidine kinase n=1 Tax=Nocardioides rubriscoriae TaxID=642762 RepID=UPI0011DF44C0|nr:GAF domain-containing sensor histidine kinase [Nocardioides rubriscoriae]
MPTADAGTAVEAQRQLLLQAYDLLDPGHPSRPDLRALVTLAALASGVSKATINLLTEDEQHQVESVGFIGSVTPRADSMCAEVIDELGPVVLADASQDPRFERNVWVTGPAGVRFYASYQLVTPAKVAIGSLCLFDDAPRELDRTAHDMLTLLAARVTDVLELELQGRRLRAAVRELEVSNRQLSDFAATVSHDLRGPLGTVRLALGMLADGTVTASDAGFLVERAERSVDRMADSIDHLLAASTVTTEGGAVLVPWRPIARQAVEDLGDDLRGVRLHLGDDQPVRCHPVGLRLVLQNLLSNAARYAGPVAPDVEVECRRTDDGWAVVVVDHGPGVPLAERDRIFDTGHRGAAGDTATGHGIGLASSLALVSRMGGRLTLDDTPGGGATFVVGLPDHDAP